MSLEITERLHLDRQVTLARVVFAALALVALLDSPAAPVRRAAQIFLCSYLILAAGMAIAGRIWRESPVRIPLAVDVVALILFLFLTPSVSPFWSLLLFVVFALAADGHTSLMLGLVVAGTGAIIFRSILRESAAAAGFMHWFVIGLGIFISGLGIGYLGAREREHLERQRFLERIMGVLKFERGLAESIRQLLGELTLEFECEQACLAIRDEELERLFVWRVKAGEREAGSPESLPLSRSDTFLSDSFEISMCWEFRNGTGAGFGWDRRTGAQFRPLPPPPGSTSAEFGAKSFMAVAIDAGGRPAGRVILVNPRGKFFQRDLRWLEQIVRQISSPLENVFLLRHLRARAIESERSRISRDLHDGILQTLLSLNIQLGVLRAKLEQKTGPLGEELANLQETVKQESEELRRMVTDLRPLRVESADLRELMFGLAERFRQEWGLGLDLFIEDRNLRLPDRICRDLFQIYRESLHNVKKHANASHVVVKLGQDETKVSLVVDDNGRGFSFSGRYTSEELDRLRLGPISIKERARSMGGTLTVESNPGLGARLTIEIPLS